MRVSAATRPQESVALLAVDGHTRPGATSGARAPGRPAATTPGRVRGFAGRLRSPLSETPDPQIGQLLVGAQQSQGVAVALTMVPLPRRHDNPHYGVILRRPQGAPAEARRDPVLLSIELDHPRRRASIQCFPEPPPHAPRGPESRRPTSDVRRGRAPGGSAAWRVSPATAPAPPAPAGPRRPRVPVVPAGRHRATRRRTLKGTPSALGNETHRSLRQMPLNSTTWAAVSTRVGAMTKPVPTGSSSLSLQ